MRYLLLSFCLTLGLFCHAQDVLITKDGDPIKVWGVEISGSSVFYRESETEDAPIKKMKKESLLMVKYQNGEKVIFDEGNSVTSTRPQPSAQSKEFGNVQVTVNTLSPDAFKDNEAAIAKFNAPVEMVFPEKMKEDIGKKKATGAYGIYGIKSNSVISNEDIEIICESGALDKKKKNKPAEWKKNGKFTPAVKFSIKNKTNRILFIDLGITYFSSIDETICYYIPSSTSSSHSTTGGASVNLGSVASAVGVGGLVGGLANGINVGGGSNNTTVNTTYAQRVISVPPMSTVGLEPKYLFGNKYKKICVGARLISYSAIYYNCDPHLYFSKKTGVMYFGDHYKYTEDCSPIQFSFVISYSYDESCTTTKTVSSFYYLKDLYGNYFKPENEFHSTHLYGKPQDSFEGIKNLFVVELQNDEDVFPKQ